MRSIFLFVVASTFILSNAATIGGIVGAPAPGTPVAGVKVVLIDGNSSGPRIDSTVSDTLGQYTFSNVSTGAKTIQADKSGYNKTTVLISINTTGQALIQNLNITINNKTSSFVGVVRRASDSTLVAGATITLTGNAETGRSVTTAANGSYRFDSVGTGTGYTVTTTLTGYNNTSVGGITATWNATTTIGTMYLTRNLGSLSGIIRRTDSTTIPISGAKVVVLLGSTKVDSATTNTNGLYTLILNAGTYNVRVSKSGFKSNRGFPTRDTTSTVIFNSTVTLNMNLTPAASTITGTITSRNTTNTVSGAKIVLQRRMGSNPAPAGNNTWYNLDSTVTGANGVYTFTNLIAAGPNPATAGQYRVLVSSTSVAFVSYPNGTTETNTDTMTVAIGGTRIFDVSVCLGFVTPENPNPCPSGILPKSMGQDSRNIRLMPYGNNLILSVNPSTYSYQISIVDLTGVQRHTVNIPAGETQAVVPAMFAPENGYLLLLK